MFLVCYNNNMKQIEINEYFKSSYLTCGVTRDNFIFENCPYEFIEIAKSLLSSPQNGVTPCVVEITKDIESQLNSTLSKCVDDFQKSIIARDFFVSIFMLALLKHSIVSNEVTSLKNGISAILSGNIEKSKKYHLESPIPFDISLKAKKLGKIELNIFLVDTDNKFLQQAINNFISSREPYSIKIFSTKNLPSYLDQLGNIIVNPHDYMARNVNDFIKIQEDEIESE